MKHVQTTFIPERGNVRYFVPSRGYGFIATEAGEDLFFYVTVLMRANLDDIPPGTPVKFFRGLYKDGRTQVHHFVEINGKVPEQGRYRLNGLRRFELVRTNSFCAKADEKEKTMGPPVVNGRRDIGVSSPSQSDLPNPALVPKYLAEKCPLSESEWIEVT